MQVSPNRMTCVWYLYSYTFESILKTVVKIKYGIRVSPSNINIYMCIIRSLIFRLQSIQFMIKLIREKSKLSYHYGL